MSTVGGLSAVVVVVEVNDRPQGGLVPDVRIQSQCQLYMHDGNNG